MKEEYNLSEKRKKLREDINYLFSKIDFGNSNLDAIAITIMNKFWEDLINSDKEFIKRLKKEIIPKSKSKVFQDEFIWCPSDLNKLINQLAGDDLK